MKEPRQLRVVVLPLPVPPETKTFAGFTSKPSMANQRNAARSVLMVLKFTMSTTVKGSALNFLMVRDGPARETGATVAFTREPSLSLASRRGVDASTLLPTARAILAIILIATSSCSNITLVLHIPCFL